jgi:hypothetical protein
MAELFPALMEQRCVGDRNWQGFEEVKGFLIDWKFLVPNNVYVCVRAGGCVSEWVSEWKTQGRR